MTRGPRTTSQNPSTRTNFFHCSASGSGGGGGTLKPDGKIRGAGELSEIEADLLLEGIFRRYGYDFRNYDGSYRKREIEMFMRMEKLRSVSGLQERIFRDPSCAERFLMSIRYSGQTQLNGSSLFLSLRKKVIPQLRTYPTIRIWQAGSATGETAYLLAILLKEERLYDCSKIYGTDLFEWVLDKAREGRFSILEIKKLESQYRKSGGGKGFSHYVIPNHQSAMFSPALKKNIVFAQHQLSTDSSFNEFQAILCTETLAHFSPALREKVLRLFHESLCMFGFLALAGKESMAGHPYLSSYKPLDKHSCLFQRIR